MAPRESVVFLSDLSHVAENFNPLRGKFPWGHCGGGWVDLVNFLWLVVLRISVKESRCFSLRVYINWLEFELWALYDGKFGQWWWCDFMKFSYRICESFYKNINC